MKPCAVVFRIPQGEDRRVIKTYIILPLHEEINVSQVVDQMLKDLPEQHQQRYEFAQRTYTTLCETYEDRRKRWEDKEAKIAEWTKQMAAWREAYKLAQSARAEGEEVPIPAKPEPLPTEEIVGAEPTKPVPPAEFVPITTFAQAVDHLSASDFENAGLKVLEIYDEFDVVTFDGK